MMAAAKITPEQQAQIEANIATAAKRAADRSIITRKQREEAKRIRVTVRAEAQFELGARIVDDPYEPGAKITVPANVRADPIIRMRAKGEIDEGQFIAAEKLRFHIENSGERGAPAVDPTKEPVDGSPKHREVSASVLASVKELVRCQRLLGLFTYRIVRGFVSDGLNGSLIAQAAQHRVDRKHVVGVLRDGLDQIGIMWGIVSGPQHVNKRSAIIAYLNDTPDWAHEENVVNIAYSQKGS
jgi:hypothetical protein